MPLLDLKTDLKSLKYGQDQPGGGSSGQPYIKTDINTVDSGLNRLRFTKFDDGLIRGGAVGTANAAIVDTLRIGKFLTDAPQGPLFIVKQVGLQLSNPRVETITQNTDRPISGQGFLNNTINFVSNTANKIENIVGPIRIYNLGINTLAQVPVNAIGGHIVRHGFLPNNDDSKYYEKVVTENNQQNSNINDATWELTGNRLVKLTKKFKLGDRQSNNTQNRQSINVINSTLSLFNTISTALGGPQFPSISPDPKEQIIDQYIGGPGSVYGIGSTNIRRSSYTEDGFLLSQSLDNSTNYAGKTRNDKGETEEINYTSGLGRGDKAIFNYPGVPTDKDKIDQGIVNVASIEPTMDFKSPSLLTYDKLVKNISNQQSLKNPNKLDSYIDPSGSIIDVYVNQFGIYDNTHDGGKVDNTKGNYSTTDVGTIGYKNSYGEIFIIKGFTKWSEVSRENRISSGRRDGINLTPIFSEANYFGNDSITIPNEVGTNPDGSFNIRDLVKFRIQSVNTDSPKLGDWMVFRAYLTSFSDNVDSKWTDITYVGRGNPFYIYTGFNRKIQVGFKVAALSAEEMQPMYQKLNYLMASLMPDYKDNIMRGPLHRLTVGNYIDSQLGKLDSVSYTIPNDSPWEIAIDEPEGGTKQLILPHIIEVQMSFTPIGAETSQENKVEAKEDNISIIAQNNTGADAKTIQYYRGFKSK